MDVFLLWHVHESPDGQEDAKLLGVYASAEDAEAARLRVADQPGFRDLPEGFEICPYTVGRDHWAEGYISWDEAIQAPGKTSPDPDSG